MKVTRQGLKLYPAFVPEDEGLGSPYLLLKSLELQVSETHDLLPDLAKSLAE